MGSMKEQGIKSILMRSPSWATAGDDEIPILRAKKRTTETPIKLEIPLAKSIEFLRRKRLNFVMTFYSPMGINLLFWENGVSRDCVSRVKTDQLYPIGDAAISSNELRSAVLGTKLSIRLSRNYSSKKKKANRSLSTRKYFKALHYILTLIP